MRIGIDIDGVMYHFGKTARYMFREVLPNSPYKNAEWANREHRGWTDFQDNVSKEHWNWLWNEGVKLGLFRHGHLYAGTIVAIRRLAELGEIHLITQRPARAVQDTFDWLAYHQLPIRGVSILTNQEPKSTVKPEMDVYLDDKPEVVMDLAFNTEAKAVALMDRPWNQKFFFPANRPHGRLIRVSSWNMFIRAVEVISAKV